VVDTRLRISLVLAALTAALALGLCSCSSGGSNNAPGGFAGASTTDTSRPFLEVNPAWPGGIGSEVLVLPPTTKIRAGDGSPGAALVGEVDALNAGDEAGTCQYLQPSAQSQCRAELGSAPARSGPTIQHFALGYVVVDGSEALVGVTGTFCLPQGTPRCVTNTDPAAIFSTGKPFAILWSEALAADSDSPSNAYSLAPCVEADGGWYVYSPPGGS
jgi:hypothetical protein